MIDVSAMSESGEMCDIETMNSPQFSPESDHELMDVVNGHVNRDAGAITNGS